MQTINDQWKDITLENIIRTVKMKIRGYEKDETTKKSTGKLLYESEIDATFDFNGVTFGNVINLLAIPHAKVIAQNKTRELGEDVVREFFSKPVKITELLTERQPAGAGMIVKLVDLPDEEYDSFLKRIEEMRKGRKSANKEKSKSAK